MAQSDQRPGRVAEFFWLSGAAATAKRLSDADRASLLRRLLVGRQRAEAAEALWSNGHAAEGLRLAAQALEATLDMVEPFGAALGGEAPRTPTDSGPSDADANAGSDTDAGSDANVGSDADSGSGSDAESDSDASSADADSGSSSDAESDSDTDADAGSDGSGSDAESDSAAASDSDPDSASNVGRDPADSAALPSSLRLILESQGFSKARIDALEGARRSSREAVLPDWDEDMSSKEGELFQQLVTSRRRIDAAIAPALTSGRDRAWSRFSRVGGVVAFALVAAIGSYLGFRTPEGVHVTASGQWAPDFGGPEGAIDGNENTEWQLPSRAVGWLEITIEPPTRVERIRLLNGHNRQYNDRAVRQANIEIFSDGELVQTIEQTWPRVEPRPEWVEHDVGLDEVNMIRVNVRSFHLHGGALAEIEWE